MNNHLTNDDQRASFYFYEVKHACIQLEDALYRLSRVFSSTRDINMSLLIAKMRMLKEKVVKQEVIDSE